MYRLPRFDKKTKRLLDPHVVILGAGASKAACPNDKNGKEVPLLKDIHKVLGLTDVLKQNGYTDLDNFESLYSQICTREDQKDLKKEIEDKVFEYFSYLELPDEINLYDYILLSLTSKDVIISFNWDPFLLQSYIRNRKVGNLPQLIFPHGNVAVGLCYNCLTKGYVKEHCFNCGNSFEKMPLLFPVKKKNYYDGSIIENEWNEAKIALSNACGLTIFGYGVPETDNEALELIKTSFEESQIKEIAPLTIINLDNEKQNQIDKWSSIISMRVFQYCSHFNESILWKWPRVSLETLFDAILQQQPRDSKKSYKIFNSLSELQLFVKSITEFETKF